MRLVLAVILVLGFGSAKVDADIGDDFTFILAHNPLSDSLGETLVRPAEQKHFHGLKFVLRGSIRLYQICISSQDMPGCGFTPSCSRYAMRAMERYGIVYGCLMCSDRLLRCNGLGHKHHYPIHPQTGRFDDPVEANYLWDK
ncbi:membrane protein insertion efficiency factor YidD [Candidatus Zixiibacteriota bacterium]